MFLSVQSITIRQIMRQFAAQNVFSNIRLLSILLCITLVQNTSAYSQETPEPEPQLPINQNSTVDLASENGIEVGSEIGREIVKSGTQAVDNSSNPDATNQTQTTATVQTEDGIIRLEDTIRGNKEQPQVLTIVPWQLPVHQRINENTEWQLQVNQLTSIERSAFLRNLAVVNELKRAQKRADTSIEANESKD